MQATLSQYGDLGSNLSTARDFLEIHERLDEDIREKAGEMSALSAACDELAKSGDQQSQQAQVGGRLLLNHGVLVITFSVMRLKS